MIDQELYSCTVLADTIVADLLLPWLGGGVGLGDFLVEFNEKQSLVPHSSKQVVVPNQIEDMRLAKSQEIRKSLARLAIEDISELSETNVETPFNLQLSQTLHENRLILARLQLAGDSNDHSADVVDIMRPTLDCFQHCLTR